MDILGRTNTLAEISQELSIDPDFAGFWNRLNQLIH
jgi:hypothetical protein